MVERHVSGATAATGVLVLSMLVGLIGLSGCAPVAGPASGGAASGGASGAASGAASGGAASASGRRLASEVLAGLPVKGRASASGYLRAKFGDGWGDEDGDGCSTREEILRRDLTGKAYRPSGGCQVVASGVLADPYSGRTITFRRGATTSEAVQIDHVVALMNSWQTGAQGLTPARRAQFANDPLNLLAVDGPTNQAKGASDAASWLPPNKRHRCAYVARQVEVKAKYGLWVTGAEKAAIGKVLSACPAQRTPAH